VKTDLWMRRAWFPVVLLLTYALASCGGGGGTMVAGGGVGTGGTGISYGTVTGFGSVIVDGTTYSSATPQYLAGTDLDEVKVVTSNAVELGGQLQIQLDAQGNPSTVVIEPELIGAVANLQTTAGSFSVNGVAVRVNTDPTVGPVTYYQGVAGFIGMSNGMQVEVHGVYGVDASAQGYIQATLIEQLPSTNVITRISGVVSNLNASGFQIGSTTVQLGAATNVLPSGTSLANGQYANVWTNTAQTGNTIGAQVIRVRTLQGTAGSVQIGGLVAGLNGDQFMLSGIPVDASAADLATVAQGLAPGEYVVVQGQSTPATGVVVAGSIHAYAAQPAPVKLHGTITGFVSASNFLVRGVPVDASRATFAVGSSSASLVNGAYVEISGSVNGNAVLAASVSVPGSVPDGATVDYPGTVGSYNPTAGTFVLTLADGSTNVNVTLASNVAYGDGTASNLANGATVEISATRTAGGLLAYSVEFRSLATPIPGPDGTTPSETTGLAYDVVPSTSFKVNGLSIQITGTTQLVPGTLANGVKVEVTFIPSGGLNIAQVISVDG
jgi:hypothetical protein